MKHAFDLLYSSNLKKSSLDISYLLTTSGKGQLPLTSHKITFNAVVSQYNMGAVKLVLSFLKL